MSLILTMSDYTCAGLPNKRRQIPIGARVGNNLVRGKEKRYLGSFIKHCSRLVARIDLPALEEHLYPR